MFSVPAQLGYPALFALVGAESAGVPVPGETSLIAAGVFAGAGRLALPAVVAVAAAAAVVGDTAGYWIGRRGGRAALRAPRGPLRAARSHALERGESFFDRHGAATVFFGRFIPGVRVVAALLAGASRMPWPRFAAANAGGAVVWSATIAGLASLVGPTVASAFAIAGTAMAVGGATSWWRARHRRPRVVGW